MKKLLTAGLALGAGATITAGAISAAKNRKKLWTLLDDNDKCHEFYNVLVQWLSLRQSCGTVLNYFHRKGYRTVAIYGMKELGALLFDELRNTDVTVKYVIDKNADEVYAEVECYKPSAQLPQVDVCVVTAIHYYHTIQSAVAEFMDCPIVSLYDIIFDC